MRNADVIACVELFLETDPAPTYGKVVKAVREEAGWVPIRDAVLMTQSGLYAVGASSHPQAAVALSLYDSAFRL